MSFAINQGLFLLGIVDHYAILSLPVDAESKKVRKAYLKIAQRLHPDTCKAEGDEEKQLASDLLSKLVNPAYEQLSKPNSWSEYQVILKQLSRQLSDHEEGSLKLQSAIANELYEQSGDITTLYKGKVEELAKVNYRDIPKSLNLIAELSELNLVYLKATTQTSTSLLGSKSTVPGRTQTQTTPPAGDRPTVTQAKTTATGTQSTPNIRKTTSSSSLEAAIWRGQEHLKKKNYAKATLEFRDAIKLDPNCVEGHALMGISYLQQNQLAMAKVHIKKAYMAKPSDPLARKAKLALEKAMGSSLDTQSGSKKATNGKKGGLFGGLFGGKKK
ncbi:MAG: DnaJ domain-containing protein [Limnothrix sp. RL_2_0]|nr:DnaJ domain-containing protein [Limnothrix sp. RL_2_0]